MKNEKLLEFIDNPVDELSLEDLCELTDYLSEKSESSEVTFSISANEQRDCF